MIGLFIGAQFLAYSYSYPESPRVRAALPWLLVLRGDHWDFQTAGEEDYEDNNFQEARAHLTVARALQPRCGYCAYFLGLTLVESGHCREAREVAEVCIALAEESDISQNLESARYLTSLIPECVRIEERPRP